VGTFLFKSTRNLYSEGNGLVSGSGPRLYWQVYSWFSSHNAGHCMHESELLSNCQSVSQSFSSSWHWAPPSDMSCSGNL